MHGYHSKALQRVTMIPIHCQRMKVSETIQLIMICAFNPSQLLPAELNPHIVADAFYNGEVESEIRLLVNGSGSLTLTDFTFRKDSDREAIMEKIESIRSQTIYHHHDCTTDCKKRGKPHWL